MSTTTWASDPWVCPSFPGYSVTGDGVVFTHRKGERIGRGGKRPLIVADYRRPLRGCVTTKGYVTVGIRVGGKSRPVGVHQLVADAFLGPCPPGQQVRHLDGCPSNNRVTNLAYGSAQQNADDRMRHGRYATGGRHHGAKLTDGEAAEIRRLRAAGLKVRVLAERYRVSVSTIETVVYGKTYREECSDGKY